jgi:hypothetical protein
LEDTQLVVVPAVHAFWHTAPLHPKLLGHGVVAPGLHVPGAVPLHVPVAVTIPLLHFAPQGVVFGYTEQLAPPAAHLLSVPHEDAPWSAQAVWQQIFVLVVPSWTRQCMLVHSLSAPQVVPSPLVAHVWAVVSQKLVVQSLLPAQPTPTAHFLPAASQSAPPQSTPVSLPSFAPSMQETQVPGLDPKQRLFLQSVLFAQCFWSAHVLLPLAAEVQLPPQSRSVSVPFFTPSVQLGGEQVLAVASQILSRQSVPVVHFKPSAQPRQVGPPQSTSVSSASLMLSAQCPAVHDPMPSQTLPVPSQVVPLAALVEPHLCVVVLHVGVAHRVVDFGQSESLTHVTQLPLPSQTAPPLSVHVVVLGASVVPQQPPVQVA